jgi:L-alanine-DL-glutamate epimerase-like enolase superfamily enzyme
MSAKLSVRIERWPIRGVFAISRETKREATVVVAELRDGNLSGRGECVPDARYGETAEGVAAAIERWRDAIADGLERPRLQPVLPHGAARNALDCAFWDLEAKRAGKRAWEIAGLPKPEPVVTAYTISLATPVAMAEAARAAPYPLLKLKLGAPDDPERLAAVRAAAPNARLIADPNEGWGPNNLEENLAACAAAGVELVEQPLPDGADDLLARVDRPVPVCADESAHDRIDLPLLAGKYDAVNVKLDKAGGLTEALALTEEVARLGLTLMVGSMVGTSLGVAPALLIAGRAAFVDLDGPLLLARDRPEGLRHEGARIFPPASALWG